MWIGNEKTKTEIAEAIGMSSILRFSVISLFLSVNTCRFQRSCFLKVTTWWQ